VTIRSILSRTLAIILFSFVFTESVATKWPTTESEFAMLPPYCKARQGRQYGLKMSEAEIQKWKRALGPGFNNVHHFCAGLNTLYILNKKVNGAGKAELGGVLKEFEYTQTHSSKNFPLQPRISVEKGKLLLRLNRIGEAISEFQQAMKLKPSYTSSYAALSDYYVKIGLLDKAESILKEGLKYSPNSKKLKRRLKKLQ